MNPRLRALQAPPPQAQQPHRHTDRVHLPVDLLTSADAAARLCYTGPRAVKNFLKWANRHAVPRLYRGHVCLWEPAVLVAFLRRDKWTRERVTRDSHADKVARPMAERTRTLRAFTGGAR